MHIKLHVGLHKTASSSIQKTLNANRSLVEANGWQYPAILDERNKPLPNHQLPFYAAFLESYDWNRALVARGWDPSWVRPLFLKKIEDSLATGQPTLFSAEGISNFSEVELTLMRRFFNSQGVNPEVVMFVRSPAEMATSGFQQGVKAGGPFRVGHRRKYDVINRLFSHLDQVRAYPFSDARQDDRGPVGFFIERENLGTPKSYEIVRDNESMSDRSCRLIGFVNSVQPLTNASAATAKGNLARKFRDTDPLLHIPGKKFCFTQKELSTIQNAIEKENEQFAKLLGPEYCDSGLPASYAPDPWDADGIEAVKEALGRVPALIWPAVCLFFDIHPSVSQRMKKEVHEHVDELIKGGKEQRESVKTGLTFDDRAPEEIVRIFGMSEDSPVTIHDARASIGRVQERLSV